MTVDGAAQTVVCGGGCKNFVKKEGEEIRGERTRREEEKKEEGEFLLLATPVAYRQGRG